MTAAVEEPAVEAATPANLAEQHTADFDKYFVQFFFKIHAFGDRRKVDGVSVTYAGQVLDDEMVAGGEAKLIKAERLAPVNKARRRLRNYVRRWCLSGDTDSCYCVNVARSEEFFENFNRLRAELDEAADELANAIDDIREETREMWRPKMPDDAVYRDQVGKLLPATSAELRSYYSVEVRLHDKNDPRIASAMARYRTGVVRDWFEAAHRGAIEHDLNQRRAQYREPIERIRQGVEMFRQQLNQGDRLTSKSFHAFEDSLVLFGACIDVMAPDLVATVQALADELASVKAEAQRAAATKSGTFTETVKARKTSINDVISRFVDDCKAATSEAAMADRIGRMPRALRLGAFPSA
jgi:hypothetical protein